MFEKIFSIIVNYLLRFKILTSSVIWILENGRLPLKKTLLNDWLVDSYYNKWFHRNPDSNGAICFTVRKWSLTWLFSPKRISHVAVWDYYNQVFLDYDFNGNRQCTYYWFMKEVTEIYAFKLPSLLGDELVHKIKEVQKMNTDNSLFCTGLLNRANNEMILPIFKRNNIKNPSPWFIMKQILKEREAFIHKKV